MLFVGSGNSKTNKVLHGRNGSLESLYRIVHLLVFIFLCPRIDL